MLLLLLIHVINAIVIVVIDLKSRIILEASNNIVNQVSHDILVNVPAPDQLQQCDVVLLHVFILTPTIVMRSVMFVVNRLLGGFSGTFTWLRG